MPSELQIAKNILKGIEQRGFKKIDQTTCKNEDQTPIISMTDMNSTSFCG